MSEVRCGEWVKKRDPKTNAFYYCNTKTKNAVWTPPADWIEPESEKNKNHWLAVVDPNSGKTYYVNQTTMESTWVKPDDFKTDEPPPPAPGEDAGSEDDIPLPDHDPDESESDGEETPHLHKEFGINPGSPLRERQATVDALAVADNGLDTAARLASLQACLHVPVEVFDYFEEAERMANQIEWDVNQKTLAMAKRHKIVQEFVEGERAYLTTLQVIVVDMLTFILEKQQKKLRTVTPGELNALLRNLQELYEEIHGPMYGDLQEMETKEDADVEDLWAIFKKYLPKMASYSAYISGQQQAMQLLETVKNDRQNFREVIAQTEKNNKEVSISVMDAFERPLKRLKEYVTDFADLMKMSDPSDTALYSVTSEALTKMQTMYYEVESVAHRKKARTRVLGIQKQLWFPNPGNALELVTPNRFHVQDGVMQKRFNGGRLGSNYKHYWFFLFNDMLLYTTLPDKKGRLQPKYALSLLGAAVESNSGKHTSFQVRSSVKTITIKAETKEARDQWVEAIRKAILGDAAAQNSNTSEQKNKRGW